MYTKTTKNAPDSRKLDKEEVINRDIDIDVTGGKKIQKIGQKRHRQKSFFHRRSVYTSQRTVGVPVPYRFLTCDCQEKSYRNREITRLCLCHFYCKKRFPCSHIKVLQKTNEKSRDLPAIDLHFMFLTDICRTGVKEMRCSARVGEYNFSGSSAVYHSLQVPFFHGKSFIKRIEPQKKTYPLLIALLC